MATKLKLVTNNDLGRFPYAWRRAFAKGRIRLREAFGQEARRRGNKDEEARHFRAAASIRA